MSDLEPPRLLVCRLAQSTTPEERAMLLRAVPLTLCGSDGISELVYVTATVVDVQRDPLTDTETRPDLHKVPDHPGRFLVVPRRGSPERDWVGIVQEQAEGHWTAAVRHEHALPGELGVFALPGTSPYRRAAARRVEAVYVALGAT